MPKLLSFAVVLALLAQPALADEATLDALIATGDEAADDKRWPDAIRSYGAALAMARAEGHKTRLNDLYDELIEAHYVVGDYRAAYPLQNDLLDLLLESDRPLAQAQAAMKTALLAVKLRLFREAHRQLQFAETLY